MSSARFTLGIEEEFQLIEQDSGDLCSCFQSILEKSSPDLEDNIKPELLQSTVEMISDVCPDIAEARKELHSRRARLLRLVESEGKGLISSGTHPTAHWQDQERTENERYDEMEQEYQDVGRSLLIFGMHVHVGVEDKEQAILLMNQLRTWLPHLLALSSNSPFWSGRDTGIKSYRSVVWKRFPRSGMPDTFASWRDFEYYVKTLVDLQCIDNGKKIWWDIRPHPFFDTLEFRICDMPGTFEDTMALAALCQALVAKLSWLHKHNMEVRSLSRDLIDENKWRAMRYGLDAEVLDFAQRRQVGMRDSIHQLLDFVEDVVDDLGSHREMKHLRLMLEPGQGSGADRQLAIYRESGGDMHKVIKFLNQQAREGILRDEPIH
ncbi:MAG TPA: carboxylate-amine ligase [Ktedonobacteraceae bacterium]|nr:carboxylate-amine ligase [Ktedonobacteraceae bacterium]